MACGQQDFINHGDTEMEGQIKTEREVEMEALLASAREICQRRGTETAWNRFDRSIAKLGISPVTARVYKLLPDDDPTTA